MRTIGLGGGGEMAAPSISPNLDSLGRPAAMFIACDMGGLYRSTDGGASWRMLDQRLIKSDEERKKCPRDSSSRRSFWKL